MKSFDFVKINGKVEGIETIHAWVDRNIRYLTNGRHTLSISRVVRRRSVSQNRLMWMWFACIENETGQSTNDIHDYYCDKYLRHEITDPYTGELRMVAGHTSTLSTEQFTRFLNQVQSDAASELGIMLPIPGDDGYNEFEDYYKDYAR
jgi:hypothetical protein